MITMADTSKKQTETTTRGSSSQQAGTRGGQQMQNRSDLPDTETGPWTGAPPEAVTHQPGQQRSEDYGMDQTSRVIRESRERGDPEFQQSEEDLHARQEDLGKPESYYLQKGGRGQRMGAYEKGLCDREHGMSERERGMSERERGMSERERAMYDRECAMSERERSSWGESSTGGMSSGSSQTEMNRR